MNEMTWVLGGLVTLLLGTFVVFLIRVSSGLSVVQNTVSTFQAMLVEAMRSNAQSHKEIWKEVNDSREEIARIRGRMNGGK